jgi:hypothetical protein
MTAYQFAKTVNALLNAAGVEKVLPPQMFYTYYKKDFIKADQRNQEGAIEWTKKYIAKHFPGVINTPADDTIKVKSERVTVEAITA